MKQKQVLRKCIACQLRKEKKEMIRIVRDPKGQVFIDPQGKSAGRGCYLCKDPVCLKKAIETNRLQSALKGPVPEGLYEELSRYVEE